MYNLNSFTYWKDPLVRIKRIGIYPLDDEGKTQYFSKESFVHHYLKPKIPGEEFELPNNPSKNEINEEKKENMKTKEINCEDNINKVLSNNKTTSKTILQTEQNTEPRKMKYPLDLKSNTISASIQNNFNKRYNSIEKKKKLKLKKINETKSIAKTRNIKDALFFGKIQNNSSNKKRNLALSLDKKARLTGLKIFPNRTAKINPKLPLIMERFKNENGNKIKIIKTETKEMGENYNPYNFIVPHVNRTKRNIFGGLFHS